jgi:hypothetical protein
MRNVSPSLPGLLCSAPPALLATPPKCMQPSLEPARPYSSPLGRCLPRGGPNYPSPLRFRWNLPPLLLFLVASSFFCSTHHWLMDHSSRTHLAYAVCRLLSHAILNTRISCASLRHRVCFQEVGFLSCPGASPLRSIRRLRYPVRGCPEETGHRPHVRTHPYATVSQSL